jgi:excisionase family DNA binding protein
MEQKTKLVTIKEAAKMLGVAPLTLRNWDKAGKLKALRHPLNNYRVYKREDIEKLIETISSNMTPAVPRRKGLRKLEVKHLNETAE